MPTAEEIVKEAETKAAEAIETAKKQVEEMLSAAKKKAEEIVAEAKKSAKTPALKPGFEAVAVSELEQLRACFARHGK